PACGPRLLDLGSQQTALLGRCVGEVELAPAEQLPGLSAERLRQDREQAALARDRNGAVRVRESFAPDAEAAGGRCGPDERHRIVEAFRRLDRLGAER